MRDKCVQCASLRAHCAHIVANNALHCAIDARNERTNECYAPHNGQYASASEHIGHNVVHNAQLCAIVVVFQRDIGQLNVGQHKLFKRKMLFIKHFSKLFTLFCTISGLYQQLFGRISWLSDKWQPISRMIISFVCPITYNQKPGLSFATTCARISLMHHAFHK